MMIAVRTATCVIYSFNLSKRDQLSTARNVFQNVKQMLVALIFKAATELTRKRGIVCQPSQSLPIAAVVMLISFSSLRRL
jgi:hypothetical protein